MYRYITDTWLVHHWYQRRRCIPATCIEFGRLLASTCLLLALRALNYDALVLLVGRVRLALLCLLQSVEEPPPAEKALPARARQGAKRQRKRWQSLRRRKTSERRYVCIMCIACVSNVHFSVFSIRPWYMYQICIQYVFNMNPRRYNFGEQIPRNWLVSDAVSVTY